tara:strand:+ start:315 stop:566 length:252 start_codon:yes stop_codon:yes gene_type:complete
MAQLLVRNLDETLVRKLKRRAAEHGVSAEEEHRRILNEVLRRPVRTKPTLLDFLLSDEGTVSPDTELDLDRIHETDGHRDLQF